MTSADRRSRSRRGMPPLRRAELKCHRSSHEVLTCTISRAKRPLTAIDLVPRKSVALHADFTFPWAPGSPVQCVRARAAHTASEMHAHRMVTATSAVTTLVYDRDKKVLLGFRCSHTTSHLV